MAAPLRCYDPTALDPSRYEHLARWLGSLGAQRRGLLRTEHTGRTLRENLRA